MCFTGKCPIQDVATDQRINRAIDKWLLARSVRNATEDSSFARPILEDAGFADDPILMCEMEKVYQQWVKLEHTKQAKQSELKRPQRKR